MFDSVDGLSAAISEHPADKVLWAKPALWCQKAYDFLCFWKVISSTDLNMVVTNATLCPSHSVLLDEVRKLASALGKKDCVVSAIRFDFIVPKAAVFSFGTISGRLCEWKNLKGGQWPNAPNPEVYTDCLAVTEIAQTL